MLHNLFALDEITKLYSTSYGPNQETKNEKDKKKLLSFILFKQLNYSIKFLFYAIGFV